MHDYEEYPDNVVPLFGERGVPLAHGWDTPRWELMADPADWMALGKCHTEDADPDIFFEIYSETNRVAAHALCKKCPVKEECLDYAMAFNIKYGVWGDTGPAERRELNAIRYAQQRSE